MRLVFLTLLIVNVLVALWGLFLLDKPVTDNPAAAKPMLEAKVKTITADPALKLNPSSLTAEQVEPEKRLCELVGPFGSDTDADNFGERLRSIDVLSVVERIEIPSGASHWVHLPQEETSSAAFQRLAELQALSIESYVIGRGDLKNAVSLGVFSREDLADAKKAELEGLGFNPVITVKPRTVIEIWVSIQPEYAEKISDLTWERLLEGMSSQERRQNFCLPVAS